MSKGNSRRHGRGREREPSTAFDLNKSLVEQVLNRKEDPPLGASDVYAEDRARSIRARINLGNSGVESNNFSKQYLSEIPEGNGVLLEPTKVSKPLTIPDLQRNRGMIIDGNLIL